MSLASLFSALGGIKPPDQQDDSAQPQIDTSPKPAPASYPNTPPPPQMAQRQASGIKGYLSDMFYQMGEAGKKSIGLQTDAEKQQIQTKLDLEKQRTQADVLDKQSEAKYREQQTSMNAPQPVMDPQEAEALGVKVGDMISPATKLALMKAHLQYKGTLARANATVSAAAMRAMAINQKVTMRAAYMPDGSLGVGLYNRLGQFQGYADNAAIPAEYMEHIKQGQELRFDADGNLQRVPVTSTSQPLVPPPPKPNQLRDSTSQPQRGTPQNINSAPVPPNPSNIKGSLQQGAAKMVTNARPVISDGKPFQGPTANDTVYALDPAANETVATTRADAGAKGLQITGNKVSPAQVRKDQQLSNRIADVQRKVGDYGDSFSQPIDADDQTAIAYLMDGNIGAGLSAKGISVNILPQYIQSQLRAKGIHALSEAGMKRYILYNQARESLAGYQQVLTGSSRQSDMIFHLQEQQLPPPLSDKQFADTASDEFQKNIDLIGQGLPRFPGITDTQRTIKADQTKRRVERNAIEANQNNPQAYIQQHGSESRYYKGSEYTKGADGQWHKVKKP